MNWVVPNNLWKGGDVWILGGGPSIITQFKIPQDVVDKVYKGELQLSAYSPYMESIHKKHVIGINVAYLIGDWIDMTFFGDDGYFLKHKESMFTQFFGLKVGCASSCQKYPWAKFLSRDKRVPYGISSNPRCVSWNGNSGAASISVAANAGAKRIFLLGFDMKLDENNAQHWHNVYHPEKPVNSVKINKRLPFVRHLVGFPKIAADAKNKGLCIFNVNPDSAITEFPKITLQEALKL